MEKLEIKPVEIKIPVVENLKDFEKFDVVSEFVEKVTKDFKGIELKYVEANPIELSKEQLLKVLTLYQKALEIACKDINSEWRVSGSKEKEPFIKVEPAVDVGQLEMYYLDQANEFYSKNEG